MIPVLSTKKKLAQAGKLLRRPLAPRVLPPLTTRKEDDHVSSKEYCEAGSVVKMFQACFNLDALESVDPESENIPTDRRSSDAILSCPPPTSASGARNNFNAARESLEPFQANALNRYASPGSGDFLSCSDDMKYILDPAYAERTILGSHVNEKSLVRLHKPRGPDPLPLRAVKKNPEICMYYDDDEKLYQPPAFMLEHFVYKLAEKNNLSVLQVRNAVYSKHNVKKLTDLLARELNCGGQETVHVLNFDPSRIPLKENRIPRRQLLYEMSALIKAHVQEVMKTEVKSVIKFAPKYSPEYSVGHQPGAEIILYEDNSAEWASTSARIRRETAIPGVDAIFPSGYSRYFQGSRRSRSPMSAAEDESVTPSEMAVLDSLISGGTTLSFSAHFIEELPDISPLMTTLTHLNLCFNYFKHFPSEVLHLSNLEVLKMRNNPLVEIPADINSLQKLRVFIASYCLITALPKFLFDLPCLKDLSVAYNKLTFIPSDICRLKSLEILDIEGNQIPALPASCLTMERLTHVNVRNNFMHPVFWQENTQNKVQSLLDLACVSVCRARRRHGLQQVSSEVKSILAREEVCDTCKGPLFGPGLRTIRPMSKLFSVKYMPLMFRSCTPGCLHHFKNMNPEALCSLLYEEQNTSD